MSNTLYLVILNLLAKVRQVTAAAAGAADIRETTRTQLIPTYPRPTEDQAASARGQRRVSPRLLYTDWSH